MVNARAKRYEHVLNLVFGQPWAITPEYMAIIRDVVLRQSSGVHLDQGEIEAAVGPRRPSQTSLSGGVAVLPLYGPIAQRMNLMADISGGTSAQQFGVMFVQAMNDPEVASIVIDMDSPGGSVFGIQELWDTMMAHRGQKPVTVVANSMAASAAYWIATAAESISVTPGGTVGSIGVILEHTDISKALELEGIHPTLITAGKKKGSGNPYQPLSEETLADLQAKVNTYYGMFVSAVAKGRGVPVSAVRSGFGEGDVVLAQEAKRLGMVDRIETLDQAVGRMMGRGNRSGVRLAVAGLEPGTIATACNTVATGSLDAETVVQAWTMAGAEVMPAPEPEPTPEPEPVPANAQLLAARRRGFI